MESWLKRVSHKKGNKKNGQSCQTDIEGVDLFSIWIHALSYMQEYMNTIVWWSALVPELVSG